MEDRVQGGALLAFGVPSGEYRSKEAGGEVAGEAPGGGVDGERPATPGQWLKEPVEEDKPRGLGEYYEQTAEDKSNEHGAAAQPRKPAQAEICGKELS
jgi:hypothetical protein